MFLEILLNIIDILKQRIRVCERCVNIIKGHPFEISCLANNNALKILINSNSLHQLIVSKDSDLQKLCWRAKLAFIQVVFTPPKIESDSEIIKEFLECEIGQYKLERGNIVFKDSINCVPVFEIGSRDFDELKSELIPNTRINMLDYFMMKNCEHYNSFTYFVFDKIDLDITGLEKLNLIDLFHANEIERLFLVNCKEFYYSVNGKTDEMGYYNSRYKMLFPEFQRIWSIICAGDTNPEIFNWIDSLSTRLELFCRAIDQIKIECLKPANNTVSSHIKYHFGYLVLLIAGTFDNLAWFINIKYGLELGKHDVDLRKDEKNAFLNKLEKDNPELAFFISDLHRQRFINMLYPLRDCLVHREFFKSSVCKDVQKKSEIVGLISKEIYDNICDSIVDSNKLSCLFVPPDKRGIIISDLIEIIEEEYRNFVNGILSFI